METFIILLLFMLFIVIMRSVRGIYFTQNHTHKLYLRTLYKMDGQT